MSQGSPQLTTDQYMEYRRGSVGTYPTFAVVEWANGIDLPPYVMQHASIAMFEDIVTDIVIYGNDLLSLRKDMVSPSDDESHSKYREVARGLYR